MSMKLKLKKTIPHEFVLEELADLHPYTKPMFGTYGVYVGEKIVFALRQKESHPGDNGVWIATTGEHHDSLKRELPTMRSIMLFAEYGSQGTTGWQVLPEELPGFEEAALRACALVRRNDPRIGKIPKKKAPRKKLGESTRGSSKKPAGKTTKKTGKKTQKPRRKKSGSRTRK